MEKITGFVEHIVFQNTDNGYTVLGIIRGRRRNHISGYDEGHYPGRRR